MTRVAKLTVAIASLDKPDALMRCLGALLAGDVLPAEVIIVDQSRDDTTQLVIEQRPASTIPIRYYRQQRSGLSMSRNAAIAHARYPVIVITDDDCVPDSGWIATIDRTFASPNSPDAVTGRVLPLGPETLGLYAISSRTGTKRAEYGSKVAPWLVGTGANFAVKRDWFNRIGNYDDRLGAGSQGKAGEDMDVLYRLLCAGARIIYEPAILIYHERQSKTRRVASRSSYSYGMGACCAIWLRQSDPYALYILAQWLFLRTRFIASAFLNRKWTRVYEGLLVLRATMEGMIYGLGVQETSARSLETTEPS